MKIQEIKKLSKDEVLKNIDKLKKDLFNFRFQRINSEIKDLALALLTTTFVIPLNLSGFKEA